MILSKWQKAKKDITHQNEAEQSEFTVKKEYYEPDETKQYHEKPKQCVTDQDKETQTKFIQFAKWRILRVLSKY